MNATEVTITLLDRNTLQQQQLHKNDLEFVLFWARGAIQVNREIWESNKRQKKKKKTSEIIRNRKSTNQHKLRET